MKRKLITIMLIIGLWQGFALSIDKAVILPLPYAVFEKMISLTTNQSFYLAITATLLRITFSFLLALVIGTILGVFSGLFKNINQYLTPVIAFLQTIPQISYILILLVWFNSFNALIIIILLMILPVFYNNAVNGIKNIDSDLNDVIILYHHPFVFNLIHVYLPLIKGYIISAIETALPLSLKVGVMAEIFVSAKQGIGKQLYFARTQIDMTSIFAWTIWMVIIIMLISYLTNKIINKR